MVVDACAVLGMFRVGCPGFSYKVVYCLLCFVWGVVLYKRLVLSFELCLIRVVLVLCRFTDFALKICCG